MLVYNAALSLVGPFLEQPLSAHLLELDTNVRMPLSLTYEFGRRMAERGCGGIILMSSLAAFHGGPFIANYAATKAYNLVLAEGLWAEHRAGQVESTRQPDHAEAAVAPRGHPTDGAHNAQPHSHSGRTVEVVNREVRHRHGGERLHRE